MPEQPAALRMEAIVKDFPGVRAGEIHALIGENSAGKSPLMNVLAGRFPDYEGRIELFGEAVRLIGPRQALSVALSIFSRHRQKATRGLAQGAP